MKQRAFSLLLGSMLATTLALGSPAAHAGWVLASDPNPLDSATNPGLGSIAPTNQDPVTIAAWLKDLFDLADTPTLLAKADEFSGSLIDNIPDDAVYITLHYGKHPLYQDRNITLAYTCASDCGSFADIETQGLSNYRIFDEDRENHIPEPGSLGLLGAGLLGILRARSRKQSPAA